MPLTFEYAVFTAMAGAVAVMFKWILGQFVRIDKKWAECEVKHTAAQLQLAEMKGHVNELKRNNSAAMADHIANAVVKAMQK